jgi:hypothetical protein
MGECVGTDRRSTRLRPPPVDDFRDGGLAKREALAFNKKTLGESRWRKRSMKMKTKVLLAVVALSYAPLGVAGNKAEYPTEKVAEFVIEKLDVTSLPSAFRPKKEKGKKTFADYGFTAQRMDENEAIIEAAGGVKRLAIKVLDQKSSGIYVCVAEPGENGGQAKTQSVLLLKRNDSSALLRGRESFREFVACPVIGGSDSTTNAYGD